MSVIWNCLFIAIMANFVISVNHDIFKNCSRVDFCSRLRNKVSGNNLLLNPSSLVVTRSSVSAILLNSDTKQRLNVTLSAVMGDIFRLTVDEVNFKRYRVKDSLNGEPIPAIIKATASANNVTIMSGKNKAIAHIKTMKIEFYKNDVLVLVFNPRRRFTFENQTGKVAVAFEVTFPSALRVYGIPSHADQLALRTTKPGGTDPYRLYNLDTAEHEIDSPMALYGSVPVLYGHGTNYTSGLFFHNSAEQFVEITNKNDGVDAYFMAESGVVDLFVLLGTKPKDAVKQYASLTGVAPLPQLWSLGYHQCRWNYDNSSDVKNVIAKLDLNDFPVDVIWLDIEYTNGKRYFTWNPVNFTNPQELLQNLSSTNRKLVTIIDPHIKVDKNYNFYKGLNEKKYFVKNTNGSDFEGDCWPGLSSYIDFLNPNASDYYSSWYAYDKFNGSNPTLAGIWNDMNEPAVFDEDYSNEKTASKNLVHFNKVLHRDVHNIYGLLQTKATYKGLVERDNGKKRPFILTRAHFAGSQRYTAMWTGDNTADWPYLKASYQMCLNEAIAGISFCGADVGGFFNDTDPELLQRWYQAGIWLPFYRAHANMGTKRREPYLYAKEIQNRIRRAIKLRYAHISVWYTLFYEHYRNGEPVIRPLFYHYPEDANVVDIDGQVLVGPNIMARAITQAKVVSVPIYFPGGINTLWYDFEGGIAYFGKGFIKVDITLDKNPYYYRSGSIITRKDKSRRNTHDMKNDNYTIYICLDKGNEAHGTIYIDDTETFNYEKKQYLYLNLNYQKGNLTVRRIDSNANYPNAKFNIEKIIIIRFSSNLHDMIEDQAVTTERSSYTYTTDGNDIRMIDFTKTNTVKIN